MRIRKHAKISPLLYATSSLKAGALIQTHVCQLNQSPWDVMTFSPPSSPPPPPPPPPPFQANGCGVTVGNGSSSHCISLTEREFASRRQSEYSAVASKLEAAPPPLPTETPVMCGKTDGKSWQCRRVAANGNSLCEHHLSMVRSYNSTGHHASKRSAKSAPATAPPAEAPRRSRAKKAATASSSDPHDFYYYSGFGPRWGGRRGGESRRNGGSMPKNVEEEAAAASRIGIDDFDFEGEFEDEDEEDEEEEEMSRENGKKRVRKPIKARSLKSLL